MRNARLTQMMGLLVAGIFGASCTKSSDESARLETAATVSVPAQPVAETTAKTTATATAVDTPTIEPTRAPKPVSRKPPVLKRTPAAATTAPAAGSPAPAATPAPSADSTPAAAPGQDKTLSYDAATNTVTFELIGGPLGFQFNGYASGGATLTVPSEATIVMNFVNKDGTPHSAEIISGGGPLPSAATDAAIPRAYTRQLSQGLAQEESDAMRFTVPKSGTYRIFCGVSGHGPSGMWIWMKVDPAAKTPSFGPTKA